MNEIINEGRKQWPWFPKNGFEIDIRDYREPDNFENACGCTYLDCFDIVEQFKMSEREYNKIYNDKEHKNWFGYYTITDNWYDVPYFYFDQIENPCINCTQDYTGGREVFK